jgi:hypothetical protein
VNTHNETAITNMVVDHMRNVGVDPNTNRPVISILPPPTLTLYLVSTYRQGKTIAVLAPGHTHAISIAKEAHPDLEPRGAYALPVAEVSYYGIKPGIVQH